MSSVNSLTDHQNRELDDLSKEELICRVRKLEANVQNLRGVIKKRFSSQPSGHLNLLSDVDNNGENVLIPKSKKRKSRQFDFTRYRKRHIVLKFLYLGWDYQGFVVQEDTNQTIEDNLFSALIKTRLIKDRSISNYHRCGRTDKGVSAFSQVISIDVRSKLKKGLGIIENDDTPNDETDEKINKNQEDGDNQGDQDSLEIDYCDILNKVLPDEIRCISWAPVRPGFSSRFDCKGRCYYYYFPVAYLNIIAMKDAGRHLVGTHDFTNFCKKDTSRKEINNIRTIQSVDIFPAVNSSDYDSPSSYSIYIAKIAATGFLWHQIRFIMSILFSIGQGKEEVTLVQKLLDVKSITSKPQYTLASDLPLILYETCWDPADIGRWNYSESTIKQLIKHLQSLWTQQAIKASMIRSMIQHLTDNYLPSSETQQIASQLNCLISETTTKSYRPILERPRCGNND